jgi:hypothetical protein
MAEEQTRNALTWALVVINLLTGVVFLLLAFGVRVGGGGFRPLYLAIAIVNLLAGGVWLLNRLLSRG